MKNITMIVSGAPEQERLREATIEPGSRTIDLLNALGIPTTYLVSKEGSGQFFAAEEPLYEQVENGCKLRATPPAIVGLRFWQALGQALFGAAAPVELPPPTPPPERVRVVPQQTSRSVRGILVKADRRPLWQLRGWIQEGNRLRGAYRTDCGSFLGEIDLSRGRPAYYITSPPPQVLNGTHGSCFRARGGNTFWIHFNTQPSADIDSGIVAVEGLIAAGVRNGQRGGS